MTLRACIYKNCENYINFKARTINDVKLFSFPKNPERRKKWIELGEVPPNLPDSYYFFCSDHFDKKYLSINNRRTVLVGEAIPFAYSEPPNCQSNESQIEESNIDNPDGNLDYYLYEINGTNGIEEKQEFLDGQDLHVESTTMTSDMQDFHQEQLPNNLEAQEPDECIIYTEDERDNQDSFITYGNKRKLNIIQSGTASPKAKVSKASTVQKPLRKSFEKTNERFHQMSSTKSFSSLSPINRILSPSAEVNEDEINEDSLVDAEYVTTFIFKDKEYVQMPKEHYIKEKYELIKKLRKIECTLKAIKGHLNTLDV